MVQAGGAKTAMKAKNKGGSTAFCSLFRHVLKSTVQAAKSPVRALCTSSSCSTSQMVRM
jgi:hypothetical protein